MNRWVVNRGWGNNTGSSNDAMSSSDDSVSSSDDSVSSGDGSVSDHGVGGVRGNSGNVSNSGNDVGLLSVDGNMDLRIWSWIQHSWIWLQIIWIPSLWILWKEICYAEPEADAYYGYGLGYSTLGYG